MSLQTSTKRGHSQHDSALRGNIAERLREERFRIEPHQGRFASRIGLTQGKLSSLETGAREAKAEDLAAAAAAGVDVHYVLTGARVAGEALGSDATELVNIYRSLPANLKEAVITVVRLVGQSRVEDAPPASALREEQQAFHVEPVGGGLGAPAITIVESVPASEPSE